MNMKIMYAIAFDMDTDKLKEKFGADYTNRYGEIRKFLTEHHFAWQQCSLYYGDKEKVTMGTAFLVIRKMSQELIWFKECVKDARVLAIMEQDDLVPHMI
jgi:virulence-associated protein VapD